MASYRSSSARAAGSYARHPDFDDKRTAGYEVLKTEVVPRRVPTPSSSTTRPTTTDSRNNAFQQRSDGDMRTNWGQSSVRQGTNPNYMHPQPSQLRTDVGDDAKTSWNRQLRDDGAFIAFFDGQSDNSDTAKSSHTSQQQIPPRHPYGQPDSSNKNVPAQTAATTSRHYNESPSPSDPSGTSSSVHNGPTTTTTTTTPPPPMLQYTDHQAEAMKNKPSRLIEEELPKHPYYFTPAKTTKTRAEAAGRKQQAEQQQQEQPPSVSSRGGLFNVEAPFGFSISNSDQFGTGYTSSLWHYGSRPEVIDNSAVSDDDEQLEEALIPRDPTLSDRVRPESDGSVPAEELHQCLVLLWVPSGIKKSRKLDAYFVPAKEGKWRVRKLMLRITNTVTPVMRTDPETGKALPPSSRIVKTGEISIRKFDDKQTLRFQEKVHHLTQVASFSIPAQYPVPLLSAGDGDGEGGEVAGPNFNDESSSEEDAREQDQPQQHNSAFDAQSGQARTNALGLVSSNPASYHSAALSSTPAASKQSLRHLSSAAASKFNTSVVYPKSSGGALEIRHQLAQHNKERNEVRKIRSDRRLVRYTCGDVGMRIISASGDVYPIAMPSSVEVETWLASLREIIRQHEHDAAFDAGEDYASAAHSAYEDLQQNAGAAKAQLKQAIVSRLSSGGGSQRSASASTQTPNLTSNPYLTSSNAHNSAVHPPNNPNNNNTINPATGAPITDKERLASRIAELEARRPDASAYVNAFLARDIRKRSDAKAGVIKSDVAIDQPPNGGEVQLLKLDGKSTTNWRFWATKAGEPGSMTAFKLGQRSLSKPVFALREKIGAVSLHTIDADDCDIYVEFPWASTVIALISRSRGQTLYLECNTLDNRIAWETWLRLMGATKILSLEEQNALMDDTRSVRSGWRAGDEDDYSDSQSIHTSSPRPDSFAYVANYQQQPNGRWRRRRGSFDNLDYYDRDEEENGGKPAVNNGADMWKEAEDDVRNGDDIYLKNAASGLFNPDEVDRFKKRHVSSMQRPSPPRGSSPTGTNGVGSSPWLGGRPYVGFSSPLSAAALRALDSQNGAHRRRSITFLDENNRRHADGEGEDSTDKAGSRTPSSSRSELSEGDVREAIERDKDGSNDGEDEESGGVSAAALLRVGGKTNIEAAVLTNLEKEEQQLRTILESERLRSEDALSATLRELDAEYGQVMRRVDVQKQIEALQFDEGEGRSNIIGVELKCRRQLIRIGKTLSSPARNDNGEEEKDDRSQEDIDAQLVEDANKWRAYVAGLSPTKTARKGSAPSPPSLRGTGQRPQSPQRKGGVLMAPPYTGHRTAVNDTIATLEGIIVEATAQRTGRDPEAVRGALVPTSGRGSAGTNRNIAGDFSDDDEHNDEPFHGIVGEPQHGAVVPLPTPSRNPQGTAGTHPRDAEYMKRMRLKMKEANINAPPSEAKLSEVDEYTFSTAVKDGSSLHMKPSATLPSHVSAQPRGGAYFAADSTVAVSAAATDTKKKEEIRKIIKLHQELKEREMAGEGRHAVSAMLGNHNIGSPNVSHRNAAIVTSLAASPAITAAERRQLALEEKLIFEQNQKSFGTDRISSSLNALIADAENVQRRSAATREVFSSHPIDPVSKDEVASLRLRLNQSLSKDGPRQQGGDDVQLQADVLLNTTAKDYDGGRKNNSNVSYGNGMNRTLADEILGDEGQYNQTLPTDRTLPTANDKKVVAQHPAAPLPPPPPTAVNFDTAYGRSAQLIHPVVDVDPYAAGAPLDPSKTIDEHIAAHKAHTAKYPESRLLQLSKTASSTTLQCPRRRAGEEPEPEVVQSSSAAENDDDEDGQTHSNKDILQRGAMSRVPITYYQDGILHQVSSSSPLGKRLRREMEQTAIDGTKKSTNAADEFDGTAMGAAQPHTWSAFSAERVRPVNNNNVSNAKRSDQPSNAQHLENDGKADGPSASSLVDNAYNFSFGFKGFGGGGAGEPQKKTSAQDSSSTSGGDRRPVLSLEDDDKMTEYLSAVNLKTRNMPAHQQAVRAALSTTPSASYGSQTTRCAICGEDKQTVAICKTSGRKHVLIGAAGRTVAGAMTPVDSVAPPISASQLGRNQSNNSAAFQKEPPTSFYPYGYRGQPSGNNSSAVGGPRAPDISSFSSYCGEQPSSVVDYSPTAAANQLHDSPGRALRVERRRNLL